MNKEVKITITVDGVDKEIKSVDDLKEAVKSLGNEQKATADKTSFFGEKLKDVKKFFGDLKKDAKGLQNDFIGFAKGLGISEKAAKGLAVGLSALGLPILLAAIAALIEYFKNFEAGVKLLETATNALNAVIGELTASFVALFSGDFKGFINGILGIGDAVTSSIAATDKLFTATKALLELEAQNAEVNAKLNAELERNIKIIEDGTATYEQRVDALREVEEIEKQLLENKRQEIILQKQILEAQLANENNYKEQLNIKKQISGLDADIIKTQSELEIKSGEANKKIRELDIERTNKAKEEAEKRRQIEEKFQNDKVKLAQEIELLEISNDRERETRRIEFELQNQLEAIKQLEISENKKGELRVQIQEKYDLILKGIADKALEEDQQRINEILKSQEVKVITTLAQKKQELDAEEERLQAELVKAGANDDQKLALRKSFIDKRNDLELKGQEAIDIILKQLDLDDIDNAFRKAEAEIEIERQKQEEILRINGASDEEIFILNESYSKKRKKLADEESDYESELRKIAKEDSIDAIRSTFGIIQSLVGENSRLGKATAVAGAIIDTYKAANLAVASAPPPFGFIAAAANVAFGLANVKKILAVKTPGGGSVAAPSIQAPQAVAFDPRQSLGQLNLTGTPTDIMAQQAPTIRAYVVSSDMSSQQEKDRKIENISRL